MEDHTTPKKTTGMSGYPRMVAQGGYPKDARDGEPEAVRVWLLGSFRVSVGSRKVGEGEWRLRKARSLVKLLALSPGHRMHRERVMDLLWPELDARAAANNLRGALHVARRTLSPTPTIASRYLRLTGDELALCPGASLWVDVDAFEEAGAEARRSREPAVYRTAIELYTGELLPEDLYEDWAEVHREQLRETFLALLLELAGLYEERKEHGRAIEVLERALSCEPAREEAHIALMRLYALSGQRREALRQYELLGRVLRRELSAESRRLHEEILSGLFPPAEDRPPEEAPDAGPHNLPASRTSFVGRERDVVEVKRLLSMTNLLTLTGAGGCGKTRLALEVAGELVGSYPDGVWLVELAPLSEPELVPQTVAEALGVRGQPGRTLTDTLTESLRKSKALLLLDNCEHLIEAAAHLADRLLSSCSSLRILATSREPLGVAGEVNWSVSPLSVPDTDSLPAAEDLTRYESVRLFVERARSRLPTFEVTRENARSVAEVCRKLDGIPLAIELVTARITALAVEQVAERLEDSLKLLAGGPRTATRRHQTMRAALEWSYELLSEDERRLFRRLSVFAGRWTLEAAEAVGGGDGIERGKVLDLLGRLVDKSLVVTEAGEGALRYRMLEPARHYARERLEESGEAERVRKRHAAFFLALAEEAEPELIGPEQAARLLQLEREHDNLRAVRRWARESGRKELGLRLAGALWRFWFTRGHLEEGQGWIEEALSSSNGVLSDARSRALNGAGALAWQRGAAEQAEAYFEQSLAVCQELDDKPGMARAINNLAVIASSRGDYTRARELLARCLALDRELGDMRGVAYSLGELGHLAFFRGEFGQAAEYLEQALALHRRLGDKRSVGLTLSNLGAIARRTGKLQRAAQLHGESLNVVREIDDEWLTACMLIEVGCLLAQQGRAERAACVLGAADKTCKEIGFELEPHMLADYESAVEQVRLDLIDQAFEAAWNTGHAMSLEDAVDYALSDQEDRPSPISERSTPEPTGLSRREQEVAALVARGLTNRRIAAELFISERTVETHVHNILGKLGFGSRAQLAARAADLQLGGDQS